MSDEADRITPSVGDTIIQDAQAALGYDEQARQTHWLGPEVVFGLAYEFVRPAESLLDVGIGSGLSSILFHRAGLRIFGLDGSSDILEVCASKNFTEELRLHDLRKLPLPYADRSFHHVVSVAVLNSFGDLARLFREFARIMKDDGILAFTVEDQEPGQADRYAINRVDVSEAPRAGEAVLLYRHSQACIGDLLAQNGFALLRSLQFAAFEYPAEKRNVFFRAYVARKTSSPSTES